jgi:hypothetical protein
VIHRLITIFAAAVILATTAAAAWFLWPSFGDPLSHLPTPLGVPPMRDEQVERKGGREIRRIVLDAGALGTIRITVSLPDPLPARKLPVLFVMGGLRTGQNSIRHVDAPGPNAIVGFDYPIDRHAGRGLDLVPRLHELRGQVFATPGQVVAALGWLRAQAWVDAARLTPVGVSLGALLLPAALRLDQARGAAPSIAVLAYGGADVALLAPRILRKLPPALQPLLIWLGAKALQPVEPAVHLPHLKGEFLLLGGTGEDAMVPEAAARLMERLTPDPKTIIHLPGGHVGGETEVTRRLVVALRTWLAQRSLTDP